MPKVRVLKVKLSDELSHTQERQSAWKTEREHLWRGVHLGHHYQDPAYVPGLDQEVEWQRATLVLKDDGWEPVESCENLSHMEDHKKPIDEIVGNKQILTMLTRNSFTPGEWASWCWSLVHLMWGLSRWRTLSTRSRKLQKVKVLLVKLLCRRQRMNLCRKLPSRLVLWCLRKPWWMA